MLTGDQFCSEESQVLWQRHPTHISDLVAVIGGESQGPVSWELLRSSLDPITFSYPPSELQ
jgi:hypothetical protein